VEYQPASLSGFLKDKQDDFGYFWRKEDRINTIEYVGYDRNVEIGSIVVEHTKTEDGLKRLEECNWAWEQAKIKNPDGICLRDVMEEIRIKYEIYHRPQDNH
jgi:hypothetical protein